MKFKTLKSAQDEAWFLEGIGGSSAIRIFSGLRIGLDDKGAASLSADNGQLEFQIVDDGIKLSVTDETHLLQEPSSEPARFAKITSGSETYIELGDNVLKIFSASGDATEEELAAASATSVAPVSRNLQVVGNNAADVEEDGNTTRDLSIASLLRPDRTTTKSATVTDLTTVARSNKQPPEEVSPPDRFAEIIAAKLNAEKQTKDKYTAEKKAADFEKISKAKASVLNWFQQNPPYVTLSLLLFTAVIAILIAVQVIVSVADPQNRTPTTPTANSLKADVARLIEANTQFDSQRTISTARAIIAFQYANPRDNKLDPFLREWVDHLAQLAQDPDVAVDALVAGRLMQLAILTKVDSQHLKQKLESMNPAPEPVLPIFEKTPIPQGVRSNPINTQNPSASPQDLQPQNDERVEMENRSAAQKPKVLETKAEALASPPLGQTPAAQSLSKPTSLQTNQPVKAVEDKTANETESTIKQPSEVPVIDLSTPAVISANEITRATPPPIVQDSIALTKKKSIFEPQIAASVANAKKKEQKSTPEFSAEENPIPYFTLGELGVIKRQAPEYPTAAPRGASASVVVSFTVTELGKVDQITLNDNLPLYFQDATLEAIRNWEFSPVLQGTQAIPVRSSIRFTFKP